MSAQHRTPLPERSLEKQYHFYQKSIYRMAGNFGEKIFWRIAEIMTFGGIYFGGCASPLHNDIDSKMANRTRWEFNRAVS